MHATVVTLEGRASVPDNANHSSSLDGPQASGAVDEDAASRACNSRTSISDPVPMATISLLACARMERMRRHIRDNVANLHRRQLILVSRNAQPERNAALDPLLATLQQLRAQIEVQMLTVSAERRLSAAADQTLICAGTVTDDISEMIELLTWFGAEGGDDTAAC